MSTTTQSNAIVLAPEQLASNQLAQRLGLNAGTMLTTIKAQCFRNMNPDNVSNEMLATFVQVAQTLEINPLLPGMLYAYPERNGGITPIIGPDGMFKLLSSRPDILGWTTKHETIDGEKACTVTIKHKNLGEVSKTVFLSEWRVANNPNWVTRPRHMLEIRALKQCARQIIHGIPMDDDERKGFIDIDDPAITPSAADGAAAAPAAEAAAGGEPAPKRAAVPRGKGKGASALTTSDPKNVTPATAPVPAPEPQLGTAAPEGGKIIDAEIVPPAQPTPPASTPPPAAPEPEPAPAPAAAPAAPAPAPSAPAAYTPRYPQPEGFPKVFEANVAFVGTQKGNYEKRDGTKVEAGELVVVTLGGDAIAKSQILGKSESGNPVQKVIFDPENAPLLAIAKPSVTPILVTVEMWPSQSRPGKLTPIVTRFEDIEVI